MIASILSLIVALFIGLGFSYFALQNTQVVSLRFQDWQIAGVPIYVLTIASMLVGLILSFIISLAGSISQAVTLLDKDQKIKNTEKTIKDYEGKVRELELENMRLRGVRQEPHFMRQSAFGKPNVVQRLRQRLSF